MDNKDLVQSFKVALADTFAFYLKAHNFHWNVEGRSFGEYHQFFSDLYTEVHGAVDLIAEHIRTFDAYAPGSFSRFSELSNISDENNVIPCEKMMQILEQDNKTLILTLTKAYKAAEAAGKLGAANFIQDRIDVHEKHGWMLRSYSKGKH